MKTEILYFGHPVNFYNTEKESELIRVITKEFPSCLIENPNQPHHQEGYRRYKLERGDGILYFKEEVLPKMSEGIFLSFEDGKFGAGVFKEAKFLFEAHKPVWRIDVDGIIEALDFRCAEALSVDETRERVYRKK